MGRGLPRGHGQGVLLTVLGVMPESMVNKINDYLARIAEPVYRHRNWALPLATIAYGLSTVAQIVFLGGVKPMVILYTALAFSWMLLFTQNGPDIFRGPSAGMGAAPART